MGQKEIGTKTAWSGQQVSSAYRGLVDFLLFAIRDDEFRALLHKFPREHTVSGKREYNLCEIPSSDGKRTYLAATMRLIEQGNIESSNAVRDDQKTIDIPIPRKNVYALERELVDVLNIVPSDLRHID